MQRKNDRKLSVGYNKFKIQNYHFVPRDRYFGGQAKILSPPLALSDILKRRNASPTIADCKEAKVGRKGAKMRRYVGTGTSRL